jgi:formylglycine-generating enzyme required for sulfatase activity
LPTEAEWAWATRTDGGKLLKFPWGEAFPPPPQSENYADESAAGIVGTVFKGYQDGFAVSAPVGRFPPNAKGFFDLGGNVAEWVHDVYTINSEVEAMAVDPVGAAEGKYHVIRGASWAHGTLTELRLSFRDYNSEGREDVGFRVARYLEE